MSIFKFKQFQIKQNKSAAKVGTDGVLLGAWVNPNSNPQRILDIGSGTGLISLMLAQRFPNSQITALEIDKNAYEETLFNFENSPWSDRLTAKHTSFQAFETTQKFDLIISNPPFYKESVFSKNEARNRARNVIHLPFKDLIGKSKSLLTAHGMMTVIIPFNAEHEWIALAQAHGLYAYNICRVQGTASSPIKRSLITLSFFKSTPIITQLVIEKQRHVYTPAYIELTEAFYLHL